MCQCSTYGRLGARGRVIMKVRDRYVTILYSYKGMLLYNRQGRQLDEPAELHVFVLRIT